MCGLLVIAMKSKLIPWSVVFLDKLIDAQFAKKSLLLWNPKLHYCVAYH
jgi:hypothetical protein